MKVIKRLLFGIVAVAVLACIIFLEKDKDRPEERNPKTEDVLPLPSEQETAQETEQGTEQEGEADDSTAQEVPGSYVFNATSKRLAYEILGCEVLEADDLKNQQKYEASYFFSKELPTGYCEKTITDYEAIKAEVPEIKEALDNPKDYAGDKDALYTKYKDVVEKYTRVESVACRYVFLKCRITNKKKESYGDRVTLNLVSCSADESLFDFTDNACCYYSGADIDTDDEIREHRFFWHDFGSQETMECVIGMEVPLEFGADGKYYIGFLPYGQDGWFDPDTAPELFSIERLQMLGGIE